MSGADALTSRQRLVPEIGDAGQARLSRATAIVTGEGLAGSVEARYVAAAGFAEVHAPRGKIVADTRAALPAATVHERSEPDDPRNPDDAVAAVMARENADPSVAAVAIGAARAVRQIRDGIGLRTLPSTARTTAPVSRFPRPLDRIVDAIGNTPLLRLSHLPELRGARDVAVYVKLELANPAGSVKDRAAKQMILDAMADGRLDRTRTLIDSTSGNTGVAYAMIGAALGLRVELVMPSNVTAPRKRVVEAYGAKLTFSDPMEGSDGAIRLVRDMVARAPDRYFYPDQYSNPSNALAHYLGTGREILEDLGSDLTHFVAGIGTTGTMMGTTRRLKEAPFPVRCIALEPDQPLHGLEGLKHMASSLVPAIYDPRVPDEVVQVSTESGWDMADRLAREEGLHVGHSSGANVHAAVELAKRALAEGRPASIVTIGCDRGDRYFAPMRWEKSYVW